MQAYRYARLSWVAALACLVALVYWPSTLFLLSEKWLNTAETTYTHGWLILVVCIALVVRSRRELAAVPVNPSRFAVLALALAITVWLVAYRASIEGLAVPLQPLIFWLAVTAAFGWAVGLVLLFPVAYFYFAVNVWYGAPLQDLTVVVMRGVLALTGPPALIDGAVIHIPNGTFVIEEGCSGLHFMIVGLAVAALYGEQRHDRWPVRLRQLALMAGLALLANWVRVYTVIEAGYLTDMQSYLVRVEHRSFGNAIWVLLLIAVLAIARRLSPAAPAPEGAPSAQDGGPAPVRLRATLFALALLLAGAAALAFVDQRRVPVDATLPPLPLSADAWQGPLPPSPLWRPQYAGAAVERRGAYEAGGERVEVYANVYGLQQPGRKPTSYENQLFAPGDWNAGLSGAAFGACGAAVGARPCLVGALDPDLHRWVISYRYYVGRTQTASPALAQALYGIAAIATVPPSGIVAAATRCAEETCETARARLTAFWRQMDGTLSAVTGAASATVAAQAGE